MSTGARGRTQAERPTRDTSFWIRLRRGLAGGADGTQDRFGLLLLLLVSTYLLSAFTKGVAVSVLQIVLFVSVALLAVRTGRIPRRAAQMATAVTIGGSAVTVGLALGYSRDAGIGLANAWAALVLLFSVVIIVRRVLRHSIVTLQSIFGALSAYIIIGLMFAAVFGAMNRFGGGPFFVTGETANVNTLQYFSFVTLTTLGYGDFTAAASGGRAVAAMEALLGQIFLATLVARLVAAFRPSSGHEVPRPGPARPHPSGALGRSGPAGHWRRRAHTGEPGGPQLPGPDEVRRHAVAPARYPSRTRRERAR